MSSSSICRKRRRLLAALPLLLASARPPAQATPPWRAVLPEARLLGQGEMRWFGLSLYRAFLWSAARPFSLEQPFALELAYQRSFTRARLVQTSVDEMARLFAPGKAQLRRWGNALQGAFVDVNEGDRLTGVYLPSEGMRLFDQRAQLAALPDPALARAFFGIWLDPNTRAPALRRQLLGEAP